MDDELVFSNIIEIYPDIPVDGIYAYQSYYMPLKCHFPNVLSLVDKTFVALSDFDLEGTKDEIHSEDAFQIRLFSDDQFNAARGNTLFTLMENIYFQISWSMPYAGLSYQVESCGLFQSSFKFNFIDQVNGETFKMCSKTLNLMKKSGKIIFCCQK